MSADPWTAEEDEPGFDLENPAFDPAALEAAERAVREQHDDEDDWSTTGESGAHIDEPWVKVATAADGDHDRSLEPVYEVLRGAGIPAGFDPYRPGSASSPYGFLSRPVSVMVPQSFQQRARDVLRDAEIVLPGETVGSEEFARADAGLPRQTRQGWSDADIVEGRGPRLSWRIAIVVLAVLIAAAVFIAGLVAGPFLGR